MGGVGATVGPFPLGRVSVGDCRDLIGELPDGSVQVTVTSPPYWGQRDSAGVGVEEDPREWVASLVDVFARLLPKTSDDGILWVNVGDAYNTPVNWRASDASHSTLGADRAGLPADNSAYTKPRHARKAWVDKDVPWLTYGGLLGLTHRLVVGMQDAGWLYRGEVVWCLSGGAKVYARTPTGDRPVMLRDLVRAYRPETVQLWNGERWTQVLGWNRAVDDDGALQFELRSGERIGSTPGHRWPTQRGLLRTDEIRVGDVIETTRLPAPDSPRTPAFLPDADIGWLVGLYLAEGSRSGKAIQISGHIKEHERHGRLAWITAALDGTLSVYETNNKATAVLRGAAVVGVIDRYVSPGTAKTKRLRMHAWQRSNEFLAGVVRGYLSGDGHYDAKNDRWRLGFTENDEWAADLRTLAARLGAGIRLRRCVHKGFGKEFPGWRGEWRWIPATGPQSKPNGEVVAIQKSYARDFYDVGVADEPHLFALASGVLTHNSKENPLPEGRARRPHRAHEPVYLFARREDHPFRVSPPVRSVWTIPSDVNRSGAEHGSVFPVGLPARCLDAYGRVGPDVLVVDPFAGSGTTGVAAAAAGCSFVGFEVDPGRAVAANARLESVAAHPPLPW